MATKSFTEVWDTPETDPQAAADWLAWAFTADDIVAVTMLPSGVALSARCAELTESIRERGVDGLVYGSVLAELGGDTGRRRVRGGVDELAPPPQGVYFAVGSLKKAVRKKPADVDVAHMRLVVADLDVKPGAFGGWGDVIEAVNWLDRQGVGPQGLVATGSGGAHLHWRFEEPLTVERGRELGQRLTSWMRAEFGVGVDSVYEPSRLMRLPGSVRWPKRGEPSGSAVTVGTVRQASAWASRDALMRATQKAWDGQVRSATERREAASREWDGILAELGSDDLLSVGVDADSWSGRYVLATLEAAFNAEVSWARILEPWGWTRHEVDGKGRVWWTRPHEFGEAVNPRSAAVDWPDSPDVMSLQTTSERTGLAGLKAANDTLRIAGKPVLPLAKVRVAAELWRGGDVRGLMREFLARKVRGM